MDVYVKTKYGAFEGKLLSGALWHNGNSIDLSRLRSIEAIAVDSAGAPQKWKAQLLNGSHFLSDGEEMAGSFVIAIDGLAQPLSLDVTGIREFSPKWNYG